MNIISGIGSAPRQNISIGLPDNSSVELYLTYSPLQRGWFFDLVYGDFELNGFRVITGPNILRQYRNLIPFGIGILTPDNVEPTTATAFEDGTITMYLLTAEEVQQLEDDLYTAYA